MKANGKGNWKFMFTEDFKVPPGEFSDREKKVVIVSLFGKSRYSSKNCKTDIIDGKILGQGAFHDSILLNLPSVNSDACYIDGYYDEAANVVYLHLIGSFDAYTATKMFESFALKLEKKEFLTVWTEMLCEYAKNLLFLFSVSHILILTHPNSSFDISYVKLFKAIDACRNKVEEEVKKVFATNGLRLPRNCKFSSNGRFCSPRLLFYCEKCPIKVASSKDHVKKLEYALEDQIYRILRKNRIIRNHSGNALFTIPMNQDFVFVENEQNKVCRDDWINYWVNDIAQSCTSSNAALKDDYGCELAFEHFPHDIVQPTTSLEHKFHVFLSKHIEVALSSRGFAENIGHRGGDPSYFFQLPGFGVWCNIAKSLFEVISSKPQFGSHLKAVLDMDDKFSRDRCAKVFPLALATYQENIPSHYSKAYHETKVVLATSVFEVHARGPKAEEYAIKLYEECCKLWSVDKRMCEVPSLTGNPCNLAIHKEVGEITSPNYDPNEAFDSGLLLEMEHSSGVKYISSCDCGRKQGQRDDPYSIQKANDGFYKKLGQDCGCSLLEKIHFPTSHSGVEYAHVKREEMKTNKIAITAPDSAVITTIRTDPKVFAYVDAPLDCLPDYESWSLTCLGSSSLYSHNNGLSDHHYPGFMGGGAHLLPWEVTVRMDYDNEGSARKKHSREYNVKVFVGMEYECPRGHRLMSSAPDKISKCGMPRETANKIVSSDMPLYMACSCSSGGTKLISQLMRIHVVTPKAPVGVFLNPRVQPTSDPNPVFAPDGERQTKLTQSSYWLLRLPYVYGLDKSPVVVSKQMKNDVIPCGWLLANVISVAPMAK